MNFSLKTKNQAFKDVMINAKQSQDHFELFRCWL